MKATIEIPDDLYRKVKAKSALEGRPVRDVTVQLFRRWVGEGEAQARKRTSAAAGERKPAWFGALRGYAGNARGRHDMETIRKSIARGRVEGGAAERDDDG